MGAVTSWKLMSQSYSPRVQMWSSVSDLFWEWLWLHQSVTFARHPQTSKKMRGFLMCPSQPFLKPFPSLKSWFSYRRKIPTADGGVWHIHNTNIWYRMSLQLRCDFIILVAYLIHFTRLHPRACSYPAMDPSYGQSVQTVDVGFFVKLSQRPCTIVLVRSLATDALQAPLSFPCHHRPPYRCSNGCSIITEATSMHRYSL